MTGIAQYKIITEGGNSVNAEITHLRVISVLVRRELTL